MHNDVQRAGSGRADAYRERALARDDVGLDVADVVGEQDPARRQADGQRTPPRDRRHGFVLHVGAAERGDEAEEHEHHHLAESDVAVRLRPAGVGRGGDERGRPDEQQPGIHDERQSTAPTTAAIRERDDCGAAHRRGCRESARDEADGAAAVGVGAAHAVGVVVGVVDADLQRERDDERGERPPPADRPVERAGRGPDEHRRDRRAQRLRPRPLEPNANWRHKATSQVVS